MLTLSKLTKRFDRTTAVAAVSLSIPRGQIVGVIGRSGAGKSTLLRMINRLTDPSEGGIRWGGTEISGLTGSELRRWRARSAMIFQQFNLVGRLDVLTNVLLGRLNHRPLWSSLLNRFSESERAKAILALDRLDMAQTALQRADTLSGGQQQRVAIARAMMQEPDILLADEPIASLDPRNATVVMDALKRINQDHGITVICNLHTLDTARRYCDRIIGMAAGEIVFDGVPEQLTTPMAETIYGVDGMKEQLAEAVTSTAISKGPLLKPKPSPDALEPTRSTRSGGKTMTLTRHLLMTSAIGLVAIGATSTVDAADWSAEVPVFRIGILSVENEADRLKNYACWKDIIEKDLGVPVELFPAADYAGVMQGLIAGNLEAAELGSSSYAGLYLQEPEAVEPLVTYKQIDGSTGYYSVLYVKTDSPYETLDDLKDKTLAFADPNSTSGYLVPSYELKQNGYDPQEHFSQANFAGGHEQGVVAVLNDQYDAGVTWSSMVGEEAEGYSNGNLYKMVQKGALDMQDIRILWRSNEIANGPRVVRKTLPDELKAAYKQMLLDLPARDKECFHQISGGEAMEFVPVEHEFYEPIINMRRELSDSRRG